MENGDALILPYEVCYYYITSPKDMEKVLPDLEEFTSHENNFIAVDIETTGFCPYRKDIYLVQIGLPSGIQYIFDMRKGLDGRRLKKALEGPCWKAGHNIGFDAKFLMRHYGINILNHTFDTLIAEKVLRGGTEEKNTYKLDQVVLSRTNKLMEIRGHSLKDVSNEAEVENAKSMLQKSFIFHPIEKPFSAAQLAYAASDTRVLFPLIETQIKLLTKPFPNMLYDERFDLISDPHSREFFKKLYPPTLTLWPTAALEFAFLEIVALDLELGGVGFSEDLHEEVLKHVRKEYKLHRQDFLNSLGDNCQQQTLLGTACVNPDSHAQVLKALEIDLGIYIPEKSTNVQVLTRLSLELKKGTQQKRCVDAMLAYRKMAKLLDAYGETLVDSINPVTRRIHSSVNSIVRTGRMSVKRPNFQQIPNLIEWRIENKENLPEEELEKKKEELSKRPGFRECFIPREGYQFIVIDYSQQELRIAASTCNDRFMIQAYEEGKDLHSAMASSLMGVTYDEFMSIYKDEKNPRYKETKKIRDIAKTVNFGLIYGLSPFNLAARMNITIEEAQILFDQVWNTYKGIKEKLERVSGFALKHKYSNTILGRKRFYDDIQKRINWIAMAKGASQIESIARDSKMKWLYEGINERTGEENKITEDNLENIRAKMIRKYQGVISRQADNHLIQGSAVEATKLASVNLKKRFKKEELDARMALIVHDELVVEARNDHVEQAHRAVIEEMNRSMEVFFPLVPSIVEGKIENCWKK